MLILRGKNKGKREVNKDQFVERNEMVCAGRTVIKGTRVFVDTIIERFIYGWTWKETIDQFPDLDSLTPKKGKDEKTKI